MPESLEEVLEWYNLTVLKLKETSRNKDDLFKQTLSELITDGGEKAEEALCALSYCKFYLDDFNIATTTVNSTINKNIDNEEFKNSIGEIIILINKLRELYNSLLMDNILETKSNINKVIAIAGKELVSSYCEKINKRRISMCKAGHSFIALPNHPVLDNELLCPYCAYSSINKKS